MNMNKWLRKKIIFLKPCGDDNLSVKSAVCFGLRIRLVYILFLFFAQALCLVYLSWHTSPNRTEVGHLGAMAYFWHTGKYDVFNVNPPLIRMIAGIPVFLFCEPQVDFHTYSPRPQDRSEWSIGHNFVTKNNIDDLRIYVFLARLTCIPILLVGGYFGFRFATELFGYSSGLIFLTLWTFSPMILGWGATICPDVAAASLGIIGLYFFWRWLRRPVWFNAIVSGVVLGLALLTKTTWIIAPLIWTVLWIVWRFNCYNKSPRPKTIQIAAIFLIALYILNVGYLFDGSFRLLKDYKFISGAFTNNTISKNTIIQTGNRFKDSILGYIPVPFPADYVQGIDTQKLDFERGMDSYLCGEWREKGFLSYYFYVLLLKEPIEVWGLALLSLMISITPRLHRLYLNFKIDQFKIARKNRWMDKTKAVDKDLDGNDKLICATINSRQLSDAPKTSFDGTQISFLDELIILTPLFFVLLFVSSQTGFSLHPRYVVLILPMLYIFASGVVRVIPIEFLLQKILSKVILIISIILTFLVVLSSLAVFPDSTSYFNELIGLSLHSRKMKAPKYLLGSCIEWGQNDYELREWIKNHPDAKPLYITYTSSIPFSNLGIESAGMVPEDDVNLKQPIDGWVILGVNNIYDKAGKYVSYKNLEPTATIGWSIRIYQKKK
jgi:hypothetical protein